MPKNALSNSPLQSIDSPYEVTKHGDKMNGLQVPWVILVMHHLLGYGNNLYTGWTSVKYDEILIT